MTWLSPQLRVLGIFTIQAVASGGVFARIPDIQTGLAISDGMLGLALVSASVGGLAANLIAGRIVARFGTRILTLVGVPMLAVFGALSASVSSVTLLFGVLFLSGAAFSLTNVAMNVEADRVEKTYGQRIMSRCHGFWSFGMLAVSGFGVLARAFAVSAPAQLWLIVPPVLILALIFARGQKEAPHSDADKGASRGMALPSLRTVIIVLFGVSAGIGQMAAQNWSVIFMRDTFDAPDWLDTAVLPSYLLAMALGRVFADGWMAKLGSRRVAFGLTAIALMGCGLIAVSPGVGLAMLGFAMLGVGSAAHFPLMITAAARSNSRSAAEAVSAVIFLIGVAMMLTPGIFGAIAEGYNLRVAFAVLILPFAVSLSLVSRVVGRV